MITIIKNYNESNAVMQYLLQFFDNLIGVCQKRSIIFIETIGFLLQTLFV